MIRAILAIGVLATRISWIAVTCSSVTCQIAGHPDHIAITIPNNLHRHVSEKRVLFSHPLRRCQSVSQSDSWRGSIPSAGSPSPLYLTGYG